MRVRALIAASLLAAQLAGCEGTGGAVFVFDAGPDEDAGPPDLQRPTILATEPGAGASGVAPGASIRVAFSEPMAARGTIAVSADGVPVATGALAWDGSRTVATVRPSAPFPSESRVRVTIGDDLADLAGNTLALPYSFAFDVADGVRPTVVASEPAQGASGVSSRLEAITIAFSETMGSSRGTVTLSGSPGAVGEPRWIDGRTLRVPVLGLDHDGSYELALESFADASGNPLDADAYLVGGALAFRTGSDSDAPRVSGATPAEGQVNVALRGTLAIVIAFDEPMDTSAGVATLESIGGSAVLGGSWSAGGTRLELPVAGRLYPASAHRLTLAGFRDAAGNALDPAAYLGDGALDFDTGADATVPVVVWSSPREGSTDADHRLSRIEIAFDRAMDTSTDTIVVDDGGAPFDAPLAWDLSGTRAYADVSGRIHAGRAHRIDLRGLVDLAGDPLDPAAPYLGDGALDFTTRPPTGEQCRDELRITEATGRTPGGGYEWVIPETSVTIADDGPACLYSGAPSTAYSPDAVLVYRKTSAAGSAGGRYLRVSVEAPRLADRVTLAVYRDACGQGAVGGAAARVSCQWDRHAWVQVLDVGAGDYYVWVASTDSSLQDRLTVRIEELDALPEGEACGNPYTVDPGSPVYTAPASPGGEHVWTIPADAYQSADMGEPTLGGATCDADGAQGTDFVIRFDKAADDTLISVVVEGGDTAFAEVTAAARSSCDPRAPGGTTYACETGIRPGGAERHGPRRMTFAAPAGPLHVWVANTLQRSESSPATVRIQEHARAGSSCADALPIAASGSVAIAPSSPARLATPSCMQPDNASGDNRNDDGITWYRLTATEAATVVRADVAGSPANVGAIAVVEAATGRELGCAVDAAQSPIAALLPAGGGDVCVAVRNTSGVSRLELAQVRYSGVMGLATDLAIERPLGATGSELSITGDLWMTVTPSRLYMAIPSGLVTAPRAGSARAELLGLGSSMIGNAGTAVGEAVFSLDDTTSAGTGSRFFRVIDASGAPDATAWDVGTSWPSDAFDALAHDGTAFYAANDWASAVPVAIRRIAASAPGAATPVGALHATVRDTVGLALDASWFFFAGVVQVDASTSQRGLFRVPRADPGAIPERIAAIPLGATATGTTLVPRVAMAVDSTESATVLYVRAGDGRVHAIVDPASPAPIHVGAISPLGEHGDSAMAYDAAGPSLYLLETTTTTTGRLVRLD